MAGIKDIKDRVKTNQDDSDTANHDDFIHQLEDQNNMILIEKQKKG